MSSGNDVESFFAIDDITGQLFLKKQLYKSTSDHYDVSCFNYS